MTTWQIGESGTSIALDGAGRGEVTFTVTNTSPAADRAVLTVTPLDGAADSWFSVAEPQRQVAAGASVLYPVGVAVPQSTAAGTYGLQGVAYSADSDPAESSSTSKRISLTVAPPPAGKGVPRWIWLVVAAIVLLVVGVVAFLATSGGEDDDGPQNDPSSPLANTAPPSVGGAAVLGRTLTADPGEWSLDLDGVAFRWVRCTGTEDVCEPIEGEAGPEYAVVVDDVDHSLAVEVTATAGADEVTARSAPSPVVPGLAVVQAPAISGTAAIGQTLTATTGTWLPPEAALTVQWQRCTPQLTSCAAIAGEAGTAYAVRPDDVAGALRAEVRASLAGATEVAHTPPTGAVAVPDVPVPNVEGDTQAGASARLTSAGLQPVVRLVPSNSCDGLVESQDPVAATVVPAGSSVTIRVTFFDPPNENAECP
jgi:PASTA domain